MKHIDSKNIGQMPIGIYRSAKSTKRLSVATISDWFATIQPNNFNALEAVRKGKYEKSNLMCATLSCVCSENRRSLSTIESTNDVVVIDIDGKDNTKTPQDIYDIIYGLPFVYAVSFSASGKGVYAIVPTPNPTASVEPIADYLETLGIVADRCCKDLTRLRFVGSNAKIKEGQIEVWDKFDLSRSNTKVAQSTTTPKKARQIENKCPNYEHNGYGYDNKTTKTFIIGGKEVRFNLFY